MNRYKPHVHNLCYTCIHNCKVTCSPQSQEFLRCDNHTLGYTRKEYLALIKEQNVNLKKMCNKHNLSYNTLMKMLNNRMHLSYKYRYYLDYTLHEKTEYLPYIEKFEEVALG